MSPAQTQYDPTLNGVSDPPTLDDVARVAGVSTATVSRCLNAPDRVTAPTRDKVLAVVKQLGYAPNFGARALAAKRTNTIGAIIPTMENAIFARGLQAFQEELALNGLTLLVASSSYRPDLEEEQIRTLLARGADALLLIGFDRSPSVYTTLERRGIPYAIAWSFRKGSDQPAIGFDNFEAMSRLAHRVFALGHRDVAIISAPQAENDRARDRVLAIRQEARSVGLDDTRITTIETPYSVENGAAAMKALLAGVARPTAVFCGNDVLAVGAIRAIQEAGLKVPEDISVTGFDDIEIARIVTPGLTTVHVPHREMGKRAAQMIAQRLKGGEAQGSVALETRIVERASLGPVAKPA